MQLVFLNIMYYCKTIQFISNWIPQPQRTHASETSTYTQSRYINLTYVPRIYTHISRNATRICALPLHINNLHHHHNNEWSTFCEYLLFIVCLPCFAIATFPVLLILVWIRASMFTFRLIVIAYARCSFQFRIYQHARLSHQPRQRRRYEWARTKQKLHFRLAMLMVNVYASRCLYHLTTPTQRWDVNIYFSHFKTLYTNWIWMSAIQWWRAPVCWCLKSWDFVLLT